MHTVEDQDLTRDSIGVELVDIGSTTTMSIEPRIIPRESLETGTSNSTSILFSRFIFPLVMIISYSR